MSVQNNPVPVSQPYRLLFMVSKLANNGVAHALLDLLRLLDREKFDITLLVREKGSAMDSQFERLGIRVVYVSDLNTNSRSFLSRILYAFRQRIKYLLHPDCKENPMRDAIQAIGIPFDMMILYNTLYNIEDYIHIVPKTIAYLHSNAVHDEDNDFLTEKKEYFAQTDAIICVSEDAKASLNEVLQLPDITQMLYNPISSDIVRQMALEPQPIPVNGRYICCVTRLSPEKGTIRMLYLFDQLRASGVQTKLVLVGDGSEMETVQYVMRGLRFKDDIIITGVIENPFPYMQNSVFTVIPSYTEAMPVVAMESLTLGVPIVSAYPSVQELTGGTPCILITENDDDSLLEGMRKMLTDESLYNAAKEAAVQRSALFDGKQMVRRVEEFYLDLLQK